MVATLKQLGAQVFTSLTTLPFLFSNRAAFGCLLFSSRLFSSTGEEKGLLLCYESSVNEIVLFFAQLSAFYQINETELPTEQADRE